MWWCIGMAESLLFWLITQFWCAVFQYPGAGLLLYLVPCSEVGVLEPEHLTLPSFSEMQFLLGLCPNVDWICYFPHPLRTSSRDDGGRSKRGAPLSHCGCGSCLPTKPHKKNFLAPCCTPDRSLNHSLSLRWVRVWKSVWIPVVGTVPIRSIFSQ